MINLSYNRLCSSSVTPQINKLALLFKLQKFECSSKVPNTKETRGIYQNPSKEELQWRTPIRKKPDEFRSKLSLFAPEKTNHGRIIQLLQTPIDLRLSTIRKWFTKKKIEKIQFDQRYIPERVQILGTDLAAAHFIVHRGGAVKFYHSDEWIRQDKNGEYTLPSHYDPKYIVEKLSCENMLLNYDGLENLKGLQKIKYLSVKGCIYMDDWCVDRISGQFYNSLEELDLRNCPNITERGLEALYRMNKLKVLHLDKIPSKTFELVCLLLEDLFPKLEIKYEC